MRRTATPGTPSIPCRHSGASGQRRRPAARDRVGAAKPTGTPWLALSAVEAGEHAVDGVGGWVGVKKVAADGEYAGFGSAGDVCDSDLARYEALDEAGGELEAITWADPRVSGGQARA